MFAEFEKEEMLNDEDLYINAMITILLVHTLQM